MLKKVLDLARGELGVREAPKNSTRVKYNTAYYGREVSGKAYPWCCVFLWWLFREAGAPQLFYGGGKTASCGALARYAKSHGQFVKGAYRPGDLAFFHFSGSAIEHVGLVERVEGDVLVTIEGNTGTGDDANGGAVMRRRRKKNQVAGAYRPRYEEDAMQQRQFDAMMADWLQRKAAEQPGKDSAAARAWAETQGLLLGDGQGRMQYRAFCTREQLAVILYRLANRSRGK